MKYRKLGRETRIRRSILAGLTKDVIMNGYVVTTEARAKEVRKFVDKMITYGKDGSLVTRRKALHSYIMIKMLHQKYLMNLLKLMKLEMVDILE